MQANRIDIMTEIYKDIENYEGLYQISNLGNVKNLKTGKILKQYHMKSGYLRTSLLKDGVTKFYLIHRLVAMAFVPNPNPEKFTIINHKDEDKGNPIYTNLEWCDDKYNRNYGTAIERQFYTWMKKTGSDEKWNPNLTKEERQRLWQKRYLSKPENKEKHNKLIKEYYSKPENKAKRAEYDRKRYQLKKQLKAA